MESVEGALRFLQRQFASVANEEAAWRDEKAQLEQKVRDLEEQRAQQEQTYKDAMLRVKMLEFALRQERGRYLVSAAPVSSAILANINGMRREERSGITRPAIATVSRTVERRMTQPPVESPHQGAKAEKFRTDGAIQKKASLSGEGREITRPRLNSRSPSSYDGNASAPDVRSRAFSAEVASSRVDSQTRPTPASQQRPMAVSTKTSFRPLKLKLKLIGHMDAVRSVAFHPTEPLLISGSEDCTVRVWNLASVVNGPPSQRVTELDPMLTVRTHTRSVLAVTAISGESGGGNPGSSRPSAFATAGRDGSISVIGFPLPDHDKGEPYSYEEYQDVKTFTMKRAHEDAIWDIHAHPLTNVLFSAGADGIVRTWGLTSELSLKSELRCTTTLHQQAYGHNYRGTLIPTSVYTMLSDSKTCVVGYTNSAVAQFDFHSEQLIQMARPTDVDTRDSRDSQVNKVITHPTMPLALVASQDRKIRFFDMRAGECVATILAHEDAVSTLSIDSAGLYLASGGHDGSLRIWSIADRQCVYEQAVHRSKWNESTHSVAFHPSRNFLATSGADGALKVFQ